MWKFQDFSGTQILREINFGHFELQNFKIWSPQKTAILITWAAVNFEFLRSFDIFKCEIFLKIKITSIQNC